MYRCEAGISATVNIKIEARNILDLCYYFRCALAATKPRVSKLVMQNQNRPQHREIHPNNAICNVFSFSE
jgi:hypothetical protein